MSDQHPIDDQPRSSEIPLPEINVPKTKRERVYSWILGDFPYIDEGYFESRLLLFSAWHPAASESFRQFRMLRFKRIKTIAIAVGVLLLFSTLWISPGGTASKPPSTNAPLSTIDKLIVIGVIVWFASSIMYTTTLAIAKSVKVSVRFVKGADSRSQLRFYRNVGVMLAIWKNGGSRTHALKLAGSAARALFLVIQTEHWTWASPPALSERAARLARPLLDVDTPDYLEPAQFDALCGFLLDVTIVVIAGREDLIPEIRRRHSELKPRSEVSERSIERDMLFLDPMRDRSRWEVMKDFVLPLASWLSLIISFIALLVSLAY
ncbi:hypothetical protein [Amycolatopsis sp. lyj-109]|uniref:hypothetical protein n=1 Tax=Amycolatopsis sp. lyj-109 TaxID=2789287 RepID=UPI00397E192D